MKQEPQTPLFVISLLENLHSGAKRWERQQHVPPKSSESTPIPFSVSNYEWGHSDVEKTSISELLEMNPDEFPAICGQHKSSASQE